MFFHKTYILLWQNDIVNTLNLTSNIRFIKHKFLPIIHT